MEGFRAIDIFQTRQLLKTEGKLMEKELNEPKPNRVRQADNLSKLDGHYWHGTYYREGRPQLPKEGRCLASKGTIVFTQPAFRGK